MRVHEWVLAGGRASVPACTFLLIFFFSVHPIAKEKVQNVSAPLSTGTHSRRLLGLSTVHAFCLRTLAFLACV